MLTMYARREPAENRVLTRAKDSERDVVLYRDAAATDVTGGIAEQFRDQLKDNGHDIPHQLRELGYSVEQVV